MSSYGVPTSFGVGQQDEILDVEDARRFVGRLDRASHAAEVPRLAVRHRRVGDPLELLAGEPNLLVKLVRVVECRPKAARVLEHQVEAVDVLPHLRRDDLAHAAGVFAGRGQAGEDRVRIVAVERQKADHVFFGRAESYDLANAAWSPVVITSGSHCCTGIAGRSRFRFRLTEMKRATFSARST